MMKLSDIKAKKSLGQNFLINQGILDKIVSAAETTKEDAILEVGPGTGNLTRKLSEKAGRVIAIEKDHRLISGLEQEFRNSNVKIVEADVLKLKIDELIENYKFKIENYKIIGNIPYYITSHFLKTVLGKWPAPKIIILTVQKEVAQRMVAKAPNMNLLALSVQLYAEPEIISYISKGSFRPTPKIDSAIIKLVPKEGISREENERVLTVAKRAFAGKRKQLQNTLKEIDLESLGINPASRPEDLGISNWIEIAKTIF